MLTGCDTDPDTLPEGTLSVVLEQKSSDDVCDPIGWVMVALLDDEEIGTLMYVSNVGSSMKSTMALYSVHRPSRSRKEIPTQRWLATHSSTQTPRFATALLFRAVSTTLLGPGTWPQKGWNPDGAGDPEQPGDTGEAVGAVMEDEDVDNDMVTVCAGVVCPSVDI